MAEIYSDIATIQNAPTARNRFDGNKLTGRVTMARAQYTTTGSTAAADVLYLAKLPKGAVVLPGLSYIETDDCGTGISIKIGTSADDDRFTSALSLATAAKVEFNSVTSLEGSNPTPLTDDTWILGTIVDAGSIAVTSSKKFTTYLAYILP